MSFVTEGEVAAGVEGCCHLFGWRTARLIKRRSDRANLISGRRTEERRRGVRGEERYHIIFQCVNCKHAPVQRRVLKPAARPDTRGAVGTGPGTTGPARRGTAAICPIRLQ